MKQEKFVKTKDYEGGKECAVKGCTNRHNEGGFIGMVCKPCYDKLKLRVGKSNKNKRGK